LEHTSFGPTHWCRSRQLIVICLLTMLTLKAESLRSSQKNLSPQTRVLHHTLWLLVQ
jgi:hypothetical protein